MKKKLLRNLGLKLLSVMIAVVLWFVVVMTNNPKDTKTFYDVPVKLVNVELLAKEGVEPKRVEGVRSSGWILLDYGDIVVHIFSKEDRLFYDLERIWRDGKNVGKEELES